MRRDGGMDEISRLVAVGLFLGSSVAAAVGREERFSCPRSINLSEIPKEPVGQNWELMIAGRSREFSNVGLFDGHPSGGASLKPDQEPEARSAVATWLFPAGTKEHWLACYYRETSALVIRATSSWSDPLCRELRCNRGRI